MKIDFPPFGPDLWSYLRFKIRERLMETNRSISVTKFHTYLVDNLWVPLRINAHDNTIVPIGGELMSREETIL